MRALVIGSSGGIGAALVAELAGQAEVVGLTRRGDGLDVTDEASIIAALARLQPPFHRIIVATGALEIGGVAPEKALRALDGATMARHFAVNATGPALVLKHALRLMPREADCRFAVLSARVGSIGDNRLGGWYAYRAAKAALNQLIHTAAVEIARSHPRAVVVCLHPGTVATPFTQKYQAQHPTVPPETAARNLIAVLERLTPQQTGGFFDWQGHEVAW